MVSFKEKMKISMSKQQTRLASIGCKPNNHKFAEPDYTVHYYEKVLCPYCLNYEVFGKFKLVKGLYVCRECKSRMYKRTLATIRKMKAEEFALWVYNNKKYFWQKIKFYSWNNKLYEMDSKFAKEFWDEYKELKGEYSDEEQY